MKKFFNNQYISNIIIGLIFLIIPNLVPLINSRINNESFAEEFEIFWTYKIDLWLYVVTIFLLILGLFTVHKLLNNKNNYKYDPESITVDRQLFQKIQKDFLRQDGIIYWLRTQHFGSAFLDKYMTPLIKIEHESFKSDFEFLNPKLESLKKIMVQDIKHFNESLTTNTFGHGRDGQSVPPEWRYEQKERYENAVEELNKLADDICNSYDDFIRQGRKILKV
ncbi:hypothetical protein SAMN04487764_0606 [Gillisia sp. Hel1_33_143]|uniref:hypothetical protein n=1 Tax=Gillisia sp. Hel1_33_143 TaxID=1336796 RepID=UPI00087D4EFB|nr:hypothetical protein [Gillisia sp. Hel1_33_143]SDR77084.1 hypothetical protein SAMN04487764_0606 [Gillisia sp. Hel1_33_143]